MINEDFFDSVESNEYEDEIEDINNGYDDYCYWCIIFLFIKIYLL